MRNLSIRNARCRSHGNQDILHGLPIGGNVLTIAECSRILAPPPRRLSGWQPIYTLDICHSTLAIGCMKHQRVTGVTAAQRLGYMIRMEDRPGTGGRNGGLPAPLAG